MSTLKRIATALLLVSGTWPAFGGAVPRLGRSASPGFVAASNIDVAPDGKDLPPGRGSVAQGAAIFADRCEACHGANGAGTPADRLTGGIGTLTSHHPVKTVASYWPYATTLFAYVRADMPIIAPRSLKPDEVYALCAYLLSVDGIVPKNAVLDAASLPGIRMPNRHGLRDAWSGKRGMR